MIEFSVTNDSDQQFSTIINGQRVTIRLWYSNFNDRWSADISIDGSPVLHGRRVVTGSDLLATYDFGIGVIFAHSEQNHSPGRDQLPEGLVKIYHVTQEEVNASVSS